MEKMSNETTSGNVRAEYIEVEPNIRLHITDAGEGRPYTEFENSMKVRRNMWL